MAIEARQIGKAQLPNSTCNESYALNRTLHAARHAVLLTSETSNATPVCLKRAAGATAPQLAPRSVGYQKLAGEQNMVVASHTPFTLTRAFLPLTTSETLP